MLIPGPNETLLHNGTACAKLARNVYRDDPQMVADTEAVGWQDVVPFRKGNTQGALGFHDGFKAAFLAVAGTNDVQDWVQNRDCQKVPLKIAGSHRTIMVHKGVLDHAQMALDGIYETGRIGHLAEYDLYCGVHSLGGAVGEMLPLMDVRIRPRQIHTFGSMRWCASDDAFDYPHDTIHWRMPLDVVPDVPLLMDLRLRAFGRVKSIGDFAHVSGRDAWVNGRVIPETEHLLRRVRRFRRLRRAWLRGAVSAWPWEYTPVRTTIRGTSAMFQQVAEDHAMDLYHDQIERNYLRKIGGRS